MKRTHVEYFCNICRARIDDDKPEFHTDFSGCHYGLCEDCQEKGFALRITPLHETDGLCISILCPENLYSSAMDEP